MISSIIESFKEELEKDETQEYIINFLDPYLNKYKLYFYIVVILLLIISTSTTFSAYVLFKNQIKK
jgi:hypothetical protein